MLDEQALSFAHLEFGQVFVSEGSSVGGHRDVVVEFSQTGLTHLCSVLSKILFPKVKLTTQKHKDVREELIQSQSTNIIYRISAKYANKVE